MKMRDIEPGGVYLGRGGQRRLVVWMYGRTVTYRMLHRGDLPYASRARLPRVGQLRRMDKSTFARLMSHEAINNEAAGGTAA